MTDAQLTDAEVAVLAAQAGADVVRRRYRTTIHRSDGRGVDLTTDVDIDAERAIRSVLTALRPDDAIVGEELGITGDSGRRWMVDPICGTLNFAAGLPIFAVNVALETGGVARVAAVADPVAGDIFWTDGEQAWDRTAGSGEDARLVPTTASRLVTVNLETEYGQSPGASLLIDEAVRAQFSPRCLSSTLPLAWVASGHQAAFVTAGDLRHSVHWSAGIALCKAARAVVTNLAGEQLHTGDHGMIAAADTGTHHMLLEALRRNAP
ncbi:inositol monophosphatase family protein [Microbacterium flavescens]|uniref:inositol monophosphatase family protein n=1 Tax=Microbacterium flavescens TaxID=69366 RepID=UPI001BDEB2AA|nr:inositol monophosphatase family protein [Microbacterium flavescens]